MMTFIEICVCITGWFLYQLIELNRLIDEDNKQDKG
jgi:hypothetical protein